MMKGNVRCATHGRGLRTRCVAMADRGLRPRLDARSTGGGSEHAGHTTMVEIKTKDGRVLAHQPDGVPGDPRHPVDTALLEAKFRDCVSFSARITRSPRTRDRRSSRLENCLT
jgi:hypothetical protein